MKYSFKPVSVVKRRLLTAGAALFLAAGGVAAPLMANDPDDPFGCASVARSQCGDANGNISYECFEAVYADCIEFYSQFG